ncbi:hypothetical protein LTR09_004697 [Extremus antarcticus]|uniref:Uncharacterized protein n=1 Tax=Extremus antarcticus TaxID=702011 RepID=A0AAJ0DI79_9PEZI|nr:hypothetical protein LTR09_004697 [Extremus antarcticus]
MDSSRVASTIEFEYYPLELRCVKALFLQKQYRQCITTSRKALDDSDEGLNRELPLRDTFLRFYLALSHDELARAMHNFSHAKVVAFHQAEQLYDEALQTIPTAEDCLASMPKAPTISEREPSPEVKVTSRHDSLQSSDTNDRYRPMSAQGPMPLSPPQHNRHNSLPVRSPPRSRSNATNSDFDDDLESHDSFNEIMTPNRFPRLERDYSSMSLLQPVQRQMSHHLMRPVRMGSPAKAYHLPSAPMLPATTQQRSLLPRLNTAPQNSSPVKKQLLTVSEQASPIDEFSPVSPLDSDDDSPISDAGIVSPFSPSTPWQDGEWNDHMNRILLEEHLKALETQLHTHVRLLRAAKQRTLEAKAERTFAHESMFRGQRGRVAESPGTLGSKRLISERSYWSFTTDEVRHMEKKNRILAAKARGWRRQRFEPERYRDLAEAAISEL